MDTSLESRDGLPEALRVLLAEYPRAAWQAHPQFSGLVQFWLERHGMFRQLLEVLTADAEAVLDRRMEPREHAARLSRLGGMLIENLHGHHRIEDHHYFPMLKSLDARIEAGFDLLDADHHAMDGLIARFAERANALIGAVSAGAPSQDAAAAMRAEIGRFGGMLERHLTDEEDLVVPVILRSGGGGLG